MMESSVVQKAVADLGKLADERPGAGTALQALASLDEGDICDSEGHTDYTSVVAAIESLATALVATVRRLPTARTATLREQLNSEQQRLLTGQASGEKQ